MSALDDPGGSSSNVPQNNPVPAVNGQTEEQAPEIAVVQNKNDLDARTDDAKDVTPATGPEQPLNGVKEKKKRRRLDDLGFSSPGPAFLTSASISSDGGGTESESDTNRTRPRRQSRLSTHVINGSALNGHQQNSRSISPAPNGSQQHHTTVEPPKQKTTSKPSIFRNFTPKASSVQQSSPSTSKVNGKGKGVDRSVGEVSRPVNGKRESTITSTVHHDSQAGSSRKDRLLDERRKQMDKVYKDHDMLVRELFHLHKFVTLFGFDPEVALQDRSDVFERFRMDYDLATQLSGTKGGRTTRRIVSARRGDLSLPIEQKQKNTLPSTSVQQQSQNGKYSNGQKRGRLRTSSINSSSDGAGSDANGKARGKEDVPSKKRAKKIILRRSKDPAVSSDGESDTLLEPDTGTTKKRKSKFIYLPRPPVEVERIDGIPRIRVLQPANLPPKARFDQSLSSYLSSWYTSGDIVGSTGEWQELSQAELIQRDEREAALYSRIDELRSEGLLQSREEALKRSHQNRAREAIRTNNYWDSILSQIGQRQHQQRVELRNKIQMAKRVARMVQTYWDEKLGRGEKQRKIEERRVRALAKWTVREVRKQWKLAVNVIRAQRNAKEKQEKDRAGREQLRTILEQSSQMLGKQQKALLEMEAQMSESEESSLDISEEESDEEDEAEDSSGSGTESGPESEESEIENNTARDDTLAALLAHEEDDVSDELEEESDFDITEASSGPENVEDDDESEEQEEQEEYGSLSQLLQPGTPDDDESIEEVNGAHAKIKEISVEPVDFEAENELKPVKTTRISKSDASPSSDVNGSHTSPEVIAAGDASDNADTSDEDAELERKMWEEDESESDEANSDAEMPVEELMKKYGYGKENKTAEIDTKAESELPDTSDEDADLERKMWEEDESESDDDQANSDAEMSIEDLKKKYGYGAESKTKPDDAKPDVDLESASQQESDDSDVSMGEQSDAGEKEPASEIETIGSATPNEDRTSVKIKPPFLLRGNLRPYQQIGFEWLVNLYNSGSNGILADEMGLGKTIQTISLLGHLACDKGIWGPHLVVAPTSVMLNWEVEFKKFLPGFKILSYYGSQRERKEKRKGWNSDNSFNVCITSYQLILADQHILRRKAWQYLVLDEAHHIKNFRSQRWQTLLGFNSQRRLLLTGTPLQNNLMDLWSLMYFLMPNGINSADGMVNTGFSSMKDFQQWFSNPLNRAVESAGVGAVSEEMDAETRGMVSKLHVLLRPYLLRRLKSEVEREMPAKYEHVIKCRLSKRQQFLYNDFMSRAKTRESLASGNYLSIINCLMQLRKVCNHPDLFEQRPIVTSFAMNRSAVADYEIKELLVRRNLLSDPEHDRESVNLDVINMHFNDPSRSHLTPITSRSLKKLDASDHLLHAKTQIPPSEPIDTWTIEGYTNSMKKRQQNELASKWQHIGYLNRLRCEASPPRHFDDDTIQLLKRFGNEDRLAPFSLVKDSRRGHLTRCDPVHKMIYSNEDRREAVQGFIDRFAFVTPKAVSTDMPKWALPGFDYSTIPAPAQDVSFDTLHKSAVKLQIAFPDASLLQYDCGKMQELAKLMDKCKYGSHRILIFTQMTKVLDILEIWLNFNGFNYLRLDGQTKVEDRQSLTEKFNRDDRIKAFILSTRSGGLGINLTGADYVLFFDIDWNFQIEAQCMDRAHRIGQTRDVHIYRFVSEHTIEENMLKKSQEKRLLDAMVIQDGEFNTEGLSKMSWVESMFDEGGRSIAGVRVGGYDADEQKDQPNMSGKRIEQAMDEAEDEEDAQAAREARAEIHVIDDEFAEEMDANDRENNAKNDSVPDSREVSTPLDAEGQVYENGQQEEEEGGTIDDYMLQFVDKDWDYFSTI
ncbi:uncharacterized protein FA14DRAFT_160196 [Meira miltonrushii]|uniref:DNA helicase n=1 Tax=Meira miltonrushii TaxID=1280837 RepID=A0A316VGS7_9BASI|nr:uncharacterized protein FA14DRAFT_160196 [Meira miltonrushii]PWN34705.1 hypothetical protein FA14DRAFT_160196 [Meira miltonrushii]